MLADFYLLWNILFLENLCSSLLPCGKIYLVHSSKDFGECYWLQLRGRRK